jgi:hypothetical protein
MVGKAVDFLTPLTSSVKVFRHLLMTRGYTSQFLMNLQDYPLPLPQQIW